MKVELRPAKLEDLPTIRTIFRTSSLSNDGDREVLLAHPEVLEFSPAALIEERTRVACQSGQVIGFATGASSGDASLEVEDLFVDPAWMGHGVGRLLVLDLVETARAGQAARVEVTANPHALGFYKQMGFVECGEVLTELGRRGVRMRLTL